MTKVIINGCSVDFDAAVNLMDKEITEELHSFFSRQDDFSCQDFVDAYVIAHAEKYDGEEFTVN